MNPWRKECAFRGRLVMVGFGCIGQGVVPLLLRHIEMSARQMLIVAPGDEGDMVVQSYGVHRLKVHLTADNLAQVLRPLLGEGDFLLNLSVDVSSTALITFCRRFGALYLDTCIEPWAGGYFDAGRPSAQRTNHALREAALALREPDLRGPTAVLTHGANPGLVSHFVRQALLDLAPGVDAGLLDEAAPGRWARLAQRLGVKVVHIAERDTQMAPRRKAPGEFVNTWSALAFVSEGCQPAELGWGTHERHFPADGRRHAQGSPAAIYLERPGAATQVRSWTPLCGAQHAFLITHGESISIADHLTLGDPQRPDYRPTVHYAYHPCDDALLSLHELAGRNWRMQPRSRVLKDDIASGVDELGVLLMGPAQGAYWYGSRLSIEQARALAPENSATSLQVAAAVMAGVIWAMRNPRHDVVEPDDLPHDEILAMCRPYLGELFGVFTEWTPLEGRGRLFAEDLDTSDPWQFKNFRVT
ncbi:saccharopine dehydrogenase C-terminal domain-containing protein [uncultured Piscinibacter sp.]|uniref:homospermidine synthase n=1 Tax=uncultured Piscinibacter sp. TaxID=1131835 RepID=UPI0026068D1D|nr:saccharopine dehydrogenase C-terminal domain-containing protein [uncultured Piscinibacter sp.]